MRYIQVKWLHEYPDEPIWIYSEVDEEGWETRKIEIFPNGSVGYASEEYCTETSRLSEIPIGSLEEINRDPQFQASEIDDVKFEELWRQVTRGHGQTEIQATLPESS